MMRTSGFSLRGIFFDDLLSFLRTEKKLSEIALSPLAIVRIIIAVATYNVFQISEETAIPRPNKGESGSLNTSKILGQTVQVRSGQRFSPDELITGSGDGMKHMLRELIRMSGKTVRGDEYEATAGEVDATVLEFNKAIVYQCAVEYWHDCIAK